MSGVMSGVMAGVTRLLALPLLALIWLYRMMISPLLGANCRHLPTCSDYAREAIERYGPLRGGWFALKRISRCHPWADPMFDPVPEGEDGEAPGRGARPK